MDHGAVRARSNADEPRLRRSGSTVRMVVGAELAFAVGVLVRLDLVLVVVVRVIRARPGIVAMRMGVLVNVIVAVHVLVLVAVRHAVVDMFMGVNVAMTMGVAVAVQVTVVHVPDSLGESDPPGHYRMAGVRGKPHALPCNPLGGGRPMV